MYGLPSHRHGGCWWDKGKSTSSGNQAHVQRYKSQECGKFTLTQDKTSEKAINSDAQQKTLHGEINCQEN
jgi:hypothetical protein